MRFAVLLAGLLVAPLHATTLVPGVVAAETRFRTRLTDPPPSPPISILDNDANLKTNLAKHFIR